MLIFIMPAIFQYDGNKQSGIYIWEQCEVLRRHGHELVILDASSRNYRAWKNCGKSFKYNSPVGQVYVKNTRGILESRLPRLAVRSYFKNVSGLFDKAAAEYGRPDFIYAHFTFPCGYAAFKLSKKYNIPYIVQEHYSLFLQENLPDYIKRITKKTIEGAASFYAVSKPLGKNIKEFSGANKEIGVIYNLINDRYRYYPVEPGERFIFFSAGNLFKSKKFDLLIDAFDIAFSKDDPVELRIAGAGPEYEYLKDRIEKKGRKGQIKLLGRLSSEEMLAEYKKCSCFALLSEYETFGIVYREAMAVGRPVIAAKNGGAEENWKVEFGILVEGNSLKKSASALSTMYENYAQYSGEKISSETLRLYSGDNIYKRLEEEFNKIKADRLSAFPEDV